MATMSMATMNLAVTKGSVRTSRAAAGAAPSAVAGSTARPASAQPRRAVKLAARARGFQAGSAHAQAALRESAVARGAAPAGRLVVDAALAEDTDRVENVVIIGSGPAGYTSAIYASRANLKPLCFEGMSRGGVPGGQLMSTTEVENFPGFPQGITGPDLMDRMRQQAERWGAELISEDVEFVDTSVRPFVIRSTDREVRAHSIIIATGATAKRLGLPSEHDFWSRGISACAICDGASPLFKGKPVGVVGGGDSALEEAVYLTKYAQHVHLFVRSDKMRASKAMQDRVISNEMITVHYNSTPVDVYPDLKGRMAGLEVRDTDGEASRKVELRGLFYGIGHNPNSDIFEGQLDMDEAGYLKVEGANRTSVEGVYSAGDVHDTEWRQAITAAGSGCSAAISVERYLTMNGLVSEFHQPEENLVQVEGAKVEVVEANPNTAETPKVETKQDFDITKQYHAGQFALRKLYHESPRLLGVLYTSPTCGPCRRLKPMLAKVLGEYEDSVHFVEIDIVDDPEIAEAAGVMGTPRVDFFYKKDRVEVMNGVKMKSDYRKVFDQYVDKVKAEV